MQEGVVNNLAFKANHWWIFCKLSVLVLDVCNRHVEVQVTLINPTVVFFCPRQSPIPECFQEGRSAFSRCGKFLNLHGAGLFRISFYKWCFSFNLKILESECVCSPGSLQNRIVKQEIWFKTLLCNFCNITIPLQLERSKDQHGSCALSVWNSAGEDKPHIWLLDL